MSAKNRIAIDPNSLMMDYVNAGHPAGLVRRNNDLYRLQETGHPGGCFDQPAFRMDRFQLARYDRLLQDNDGLIDSSKPFGEMFGADWFDNAVRRLDGDHKLFLQRLFTEIGNFLAGQSPLDDCTTLEVGLYKASSAG